MVGLGSIAGGALGGAAVVIGIRAIDQYSKEFGRAEKGVGRLGKSLKGLGRIAGTVGLAAAAGIAAFGISAIKAAADIDVVSRNFNKLSEDSNNLLYSLDNATAGIVTDLNLMKAANKALVGGLEQDSIEEMFKSAAIVGQAMGKDVTSSISDITEALVKLEPEILDNLGINVKLSDTNRGLAERLGVTQNMLTETQKAAEFQRVAMEKLNEKAAQLGGSIEVGLNENLLKLRKNFEQVQVEIGSELLPTVIELSETLLENKEIVSDLGSATLKTFEMVGKGLKAAYIFTGLFANNLATAANIMKELSTGDFEGAIEAAASGVNVNKLIKAGLDIETAVEYGGAGISDPEVVRATEARLKQLKEENRTIIIGNETIQDSADVRMGADSKLMNSSLEVADSAGLASDGIERFGVSLSDLNKSLSGDLITRGSGGYSKTGAEAFAINTTALDRAERASTRSSGGGSHEELGQGAVSNGVQTNVGYDISSGTYKNISEFNNKAAGVNNYYVMADATSVNQEQGTLLANQGMTTS